MFTFNPDFTQAGLYPLSYVVSDTRGGQAIGNQFTITVTNTNRAPVLAAIGNQSVAENSPLTFTATATDADGDAVSFSNSALPSGASFNTTTGAFAWTPTFSQEGSYPLTITASDGSLNRRGTVLSKKSGARRTSTSTIATSSPAAVDRA